MQSLNILHVFRAPVGGLFRHVLDLTREQIARGHRVGLIADLRTGGARADDALRVLEPSLALGLTRIPMRRHANPGDLFALAHVMRRVAQTEADVVHGHGAKGGAYARLARSASKRAVRAYTPHGGSLLFGHDTLAGKFYLATERLLMLRGDLFLFESAYSAEIFRNKIGNPRGLVRVVHNGVSRAEFEPIVAQRRRHRSGVLGRVAAGQGHRRADRRHCPLARRRPHRHRNIGRRRSRPRGAAGAGRRLGLGGAVHFMPAMPARQAQALGRIMVVPSRAESLPYVVLEAAAAGKPLITTKVGGIPEIYGPLSDTLVPPDDAGALAQAIAPSARPPGRHGRDRAKVARAGAASFSVDTMVDGVLSAYQAALENVAQNRPAVKTLFEHPISLF